MGDKNIVLRDLRISYNGAFELNEFFMEIDRWLSNNGYDKEQKKYVEHMTGGGKRIEIELEGHKSFSRWHTGILRLRVLFDNFKEEFIKVKYRKVKVNHADALVYIDGIMDTRLKESRYHSKPLYQFTIQIIDRFIYTFWSNKHVGSVVSDGNSLYKQVRSFFSLQKYKFQE